MTAFADWLVGMTLWTALVVLAARIADRLLEGRVSARARIVLYAAVLVRVALPVRWDAGLGETVAARTVTSIAASAGRAAAAPPATLVDVFVPAWPWFAIVVVTVYAAGVVALGAARVVAARRASSGLRPARASLAALSPRVPVFESDEFGPAVIGVLRPRIVIPSRLADSLDDAALAWIVRHETSHVASRDPWLLAFSQIVATALWPVLPLWFALARVRSLMEVACDERTLCDVEAGGRRGYVRALMDTTNAASRQVRAIPGLAFGDALSERVRALASTAARWPAKAQAAVASVLAAALVACSSGSPPVAAPAPGWKTDGVLVSVDTVEGGEVTVTGDDGVERPSVLHCVNARLFATKQGEPLIVRSGVRIVASSEPGAAQVIRYSDAADVEGVEFVAAPAVIALDGHESTIELAWRDTEPDAQKCRATFVVRAADAGSANVSVRFEQFEGGVLVREVKDTTLHLAKGEKALVITKPPAAK